MKHIFGETCEGCAFWADFGDYGTCLNEYGLDYPEYGSICPEFQPKDMDALVASDILEDLQDDADYDEWYALQYAIDALADARRKDKASREEFKREFGE